MRRARPSRKRKAQAIFIGALLLFAATIALVLYLKHQQELETAAAPPKMTSYVMDEAQLIDPGARVRMTEVTGRRTVPQIFIGDTHVGGCDDLVALDSRGGLLPLLGAA